MNKRCVVSLIAFFSIVVVSAPAYAGVGDWLYSFFFPTKASLQQWKEKIFSGHTTYDIKLEEGDGYLFGHSENTASALYAEVKGWELEKNPVLSWSWRARIHPTRRPDLAKQSEDYAIRVYVIFPALVFLNSKSLAYAWDPKAKSESVLPSDFTKNLKIMVVQSGPVTNEWVNEERDVFKDYEKAFGEKPTLQPKAIAILVDSENTKTPAQGEIKFVKVGGAK